MPTAGCQAAEWAVWAVWICKRTNALNVVQTALLSRQYVERLSWRRVLARRRPGTAYRPLPTATTVMARTIAIARDRDAGGCELTLVLLPGPLTTDAAGPHRMYAFVRNRAANAHVFRFVSGSRESIPRSRQILQLHNRSDRSLVLRSRRPGIAARSLAVLHRWHPLTDATGSL
jgi:hypothetical protein